MSRRALPLLLALALAAAPAGGCKRSADEAEGGDAPAGTGEAGPGRHASGRELAQAGGHGGASPEASTPVDRGDVSYAPTFGQATPMPNEDALRDAALAATKPMAISAKNGGVWRSGDGLLAVTVPPGALTTDADARFFRVDTSNLPEGPGGAPGILIDGDWGGAKFKPGASVTFQAPVDPRFVARIEQANPGADLGAMGLSRDAKGRWLLRVTVSADPAGQPAALERMKLGKSTVFEVAQLPVDPGFLPPGAAERVDRDPLPTVPRGTPTLEPLPTDDALIARYPGLPKDLAAEPAYHPVESLETEGGPGRVKVRQNVASTLAGVPGMLFCGAPNSACQLEAATPVVEAVRLNASLKAGRKPPDELLKRARKPADWSCVDRP